MDMLHNVKNDVEVLLKALLKPVSTKFRGYKKIAAQAEGLSHGEITSAVSEVIKDSIFAIEPFMVFDHDLELVNIQEGSYIKLVDAEGNVSTFEEGNYRMAQLQRSYYRNAENHKPLPRKYAEYIWNEITYAKDEGEAEEERDLELDVKPSEWIDSTVLFHCRGQLL